MAADDERAGGVGWTGSLSRLVERLDPSWRWGLGVFLGGRLLLTLFGWVQSAMGLIPPDAGRDYYFGVQPITHGVSAVLLGLAQRWDAIHYLRIATGGYSVAELSAFFPLYPLAGRAVGWLLGGHLLAGLLLVSNAALLGALVLLYRVANECIGPSAAARATVSAAFFPTSFFMYAAYPQSLALFLGLTAYWMATRERWLGAAAAGLALGLTHSTGLPLALMVGWIAFRVRPHGDRLGAIARFASASTPLLGTALFLAWRVRRGLPPYAELLRENWGRIAIWPWENLLNVLHPARSPYLFLMGWFNIVAVILSVAALIWATKRLPAAQILFLAATIVLLLGNTTILEPLSGFARYALVAFPLFIAFGAWTRGAWGRVAFPISAAVQLYAFGLFTAWIWVG